MPDPWFKTPLGQSVLKAATAPKSRRAFSGAQSSPLTFSWATQPLHVNADLQRGLRTLRARSRDLEQNNDYARKFLSMVETNVVGHAGFSLFVEPKRDDGTIDRPDAAKLEQAFWQWAKACEITGLTFTEVQRLFIRTVARDGEILVRYVPRGAFGLQMQLLDPQRLDDQYNADLPGGRKVRMGVEYDEWSVVRAYHLSVFDSADPRSGEVVRERVRVPVEELRLYFPRMSVGQLRGVPFMASALLRMQMLGGYEEAAVVAARVGAAKLGAVRMPDGDLSSMGDETSGDTAYLDGGEPGSFINLPPGAELQSWDPDYPHAQYDAFVRACIRGISSGLGVSYATLANDLENVNYSSIRAGVLEEREVWKSLQGWMIEAFLLPMYAEWLKYALISGQLALPASKYEKFNAARWQGRRWEWVDPEKDMAANVLAIKHGLKSRTEIVAEQGRDLADVWNDLKQEQQDAAKDGIVIEDLKPTTAPPAAAPKPAPAMMEEED